MDFPATIITGPSRPQPKFTPKKSQKLRAALAYAKKGKPVFPCGPGSKLPAIPKCSDAKGLAGEELAAHARSCSRGGHGFHDATTDPSRITAYWNAHRGANIGMPAGKRSGGWTLDECC